MWNALSMQSFALPAPALAAGWQLADAGLDCAVWFAACAVLGVTLSWLRGLARRGHEGPGPRPLATLGVRTGALVRA